MNVKDEILGELMEISPLLAQISRKNVYAVPEDYFETLEERICFYAKSAQNSAVGPYGKSINPLKVPVGYFNQLSDTILARVKDLEEDELSREFPVLNSLKRENVLTLPEGYFENLSHDILSAIHRKPQTRVISFTRSAWWKYAAAAIFTGIILMSAFFIFNPGNKDVSRYMAASKKYQNLNQITRGIETLPEEDIVQYLELYSRSTDNDMIIKNVDTKELPSELDYLMDENTLNTYLEKINFENH